MEMIHKDIEVKSKKDVFYIYPLGDIHLGTFNCAESHFRRLVKYIARKKNAYWFGGGDFCDCIAVSDPRFTFRSLADWIFTGTVKDIKEALTDISKQERDRFCEIVEPIKDKCLALIEGNHEAVYMKRLNNGHQYILCEQLGVRNMTDCGFIRLNFKIPNSAGRVVKIWAMHGCGAGRSVGAEPNHLMRMGQIADADIVLRGHSHTFRIEPSEPHLFIPDKGHLPDEAYQREVYKANWGCWLKSYAKGPPTYDSQAAYPPRPLKALEIKIKPFHSTSVKVCGKSVIQTKPLIQLTECPYEFEE